MDFRLGSLAGGDIDASEDKIRDVVIRIPVVGDRDFQVMVHAFSAVNHRLEMYRFPSTGSLDGSTQLCLTSRIKAPPPGFYQWMTDHLLAPELCMHEGDLIDLQHDPLGGQNDNLA